jgi:hypothetical protein
MMKTYVKGAKIYIPSGWCKLCLTNDLVTWTSGSKRIDDFIQRMQLNIDKQNNIIEWIPYDQFNDIKELWKDELTTTYSAIWKDGPLRYNYDIYEYSRQQNNKVNLKLYNSQCITDEFLYEV